MFSHPVIIIKSHLDYLGEPTAVTIQLFIRNIEIDKERRVGELYYSITQSNHILKCRKLQELLEIFIEIREYFVSSKNTGGFGQNTGITGITGGHAHPADT